MEGAGIRILAIVIIAILPMLPMFGDPFFADDYLHIDRLEEISAGSASDALQSWILDAEDAGAWWAPDSLAVKYFRPVVSFSFFLDHSLWGLRPFGYHLTNALLHILTTLLLYGIAGRVLGNGLPALAAALLFAVHPCHTEAISWISGRTSLLSGIFYAAAVFSHLKSRQRLKGRSLLIGLMLMFFALSLLAKETAITLPAILLLINLLVPGEESLKQRLTVPALTAGVGLLYLALRTWILGRAELPPFPFAYGLDDPGVFFHLLSALTLYIADLTLFIPPDPVVTHPFWREHGVLFLGLAAISYAALIASFRASRYPRVRLLTLGWLLIGLLPVLPVSVGERFLYIPSMGYCIFIGSRFPGSWRGFTAPEKRFVYAIIVLTFGVALTKTLVYSSLAANSRVAIADALVELDRVEDATELLVVDLPAASALAFPHAIRLERPQRRVRPEILSISPSFLWDTAGARSAVRIASADRLLLRREDPPYLSSYFEQAYLGERDPFVAGDQVDKGSFTIRILEAEAGRIQSFEVQFPDSQPGTRLLLQGDGFHLRPLRPSDESVPSVSTTDGG